MKKPLRDRILEMIRRHEMFRAGNRVGVAVSGGPDSLGLLRVLMDLREPLGVRLAVVHFNHRLRGADSDADESFVSGWAQRLGLEFFVAGEDVAAVADREGWNLEDAARRLRYGFFESLVQAGTLECVAVAHTADDQAETVLAHMIRGTGPAGLAGIYPIVGCVVRPLLEVRRAEIRELLEKLGDHWREDAMNQDPARTRTRIRHTLLPLLAENFQPAIVERLCQLADLCREDEAYWNVLADDWLQSRARRDAGRITIRANELASPLAALAGAGTSTERKSANLALAGRLIRRLYREARGERGGLTADHVARVIRFAEEGHSGRQIELPGGVICEREFDQITFFKSHEAKEEESGAQKHENAAGYAYPVELGKAKEVSVAIAEIGVRLRLKLIDWPRTAGETKGLAAALDAERLRAPLEIRNWRPGDTYRPAGHRRQQKVKEMFQRRKISAKERAGLPLLTSGGEIAWGRGLPPAAEFVARSGSKRGVVIAEEQL